MRGSGSSGDDRGD